MTFEGKISINSFFYKESSLPSPSSLLKLPFKPFKTLQQEFPSTKFGPSNEHQPNVIYKIPVPIVIDVMLAKLAGVLKLVRKNISGNGSNIAKHAGVIRP